MKKVLLVALGISFSANVLQASEIKWGGPYAEIQIGNASGENAIDFNGPVFSTQISSFRMSGDSKAFALGARFQLWESPFHLGAEIAAHGGNISGRQNWEAFGGAASSSVTLDSSMVYTIGAQVGFVPTNGVLEDYLLYAEVGVAAMDATLCGSVQVLSYASNDCSSGFVKGDYIALGIAKQYARGFALGAELQYYKFAASDELFVHGHNLGTLTDEVDHLTAAVTASVQFTGLFRRAMPFAKGRRSSEISSGYSPKLAAESARAIVDARLNY